MGYNFTKMQSDFRRLTGKRTTTQMSDADVKEALNNFYQLLFPLLVSPPEFKGWYSVTLADGVETYALPSTIVAVSGPVYLDDVPINFYTDHEQFFNEYPMDSTDKGEPSGVLLFDRTLYVRLIPDGAYALVLRKVSSVPDALVDGTDTPLNESWGRAITYGAAMENLSDAQDMEAVASLEPFFSKYVGWIHSGMIAQIPIGSRGAPRF